MALGNMREQSVDHLIAFCPYNDACGHQAIIDDPADTLVTWFRSKIKCGKCGGRGRWVDVRRREAGIPDNWQSRPAEKE